MQHFFLSFTIYFIKTSNLSHCYLNLWLPKPIFQHSLLLNPWPYTIAMCEPACLRSSTQQVSAATTDSVMTSSSSSNCFSRIGSFKRLKRLVVGKGPNQGCKVDEAGQSTEALCWPHVVVVKKSFCHILIGTNHPKTPKKFTSLTDSIL
jgi:hypothetical protein